MANKKILVLNGPNLNLLSVREPGIYGNQSLEEINNAISVYAKGMDISCSFLQSNCEGEIVSALHSVRTDYDGCILNAGAYTHYSYAIYDAIKAIEKPVIEVHLSNVNAREEFRKTSYVGMYAIKQIMGKGFDGYIEAIDYIIENIK